VAEIPAFKSLGPGSKTFRQSNAEGRRIGKTNSKERYPPFIPFHAHGSSITFPSNERTRRIPWKHVAHDARLTIRYGFPIAWDGWTISRQYPTSPNVPLSNASPERSRALVERRQWKYEHVEWKRKWSTFTKHTTIPSNEYIRYIK
jgi:hypothetical protein